MFSSCGTEAWYACTFSASVPLLVDAIGSTEVEAYPGVEETLCRGQSLTEYTNGNANLVRELCMEQDLSRIGIEGELQLC